MIQRFNQILLAHAVRQLAAQRHDESRGVAQVGADPHLGDGDRQAGQMGVVQVAAHQRAA